MADDFDSEAFLNAALDGADSSRGRGGTRDPFQAANRRAAARDAASDRETARTLIEAARTRSPEGYGLLLQGLNEMCLRSGRELSARERDLVFEIFGALITAVELDVRAHVSDTLADRPDMPRDLAVTLAKDAIAVAEPILSRSEALAEADLVAIIEETAETHQLAVTRRPALSGAVTEALARAGSEEVVASMLENANANVPESLMLRLAEDAADRPALHAPLARRPDLPAPAARRLYAVVGDALKQRIAMRLEAQEGTGEPSGGDAPVPDDPDAEGHPDAVMADAASAPTPGEKPHPRLLVKALTAGDHETFETLFGDFAGLDPPGVDRILNRAGPEALAIACKAGGMSKRDFGEVLSRVMDQDAPAEAARTPAFRKTVDYFGRIDAEGARRVLAAWR